MLSVVEDGESAGLGGLEVCHEMLEQILTTPDPRERLRALRDFIATAETCLARAREGRDETALALREYGLPMTTIARDAGVGDSYLARRALAQGAPRRRRPPEDGASARH